MRIPGLAVYGTRTVSIAMAVLCGAGALLWVSLHPLAAAPAGLIAAWILWFFRDPERTPPPEEHLIVSPADGTVADLEVVDESEYLGCKAMRIGVFMSVFNVHVNRSPVTGTVRHVKHEPGAFAPAYRRDASARNESNAVGLEMPAADDEASPTRILVKQIAGVLARRIVCGCAAAETLSRGERFGMIQFGSRVETYIPLTSLGEVLVAVGERVRSGSTAIASLAAPPPGVVYRIQCAKGAQLGN